jgi:hypothetical protein
MDIESACFSGMLMGGLVSLRGNICLVWRSVLMTCGAAKRNLRLVVARKELPHSTAVER